MYQIDSPRKEKGNKQKTVCQSRPLVEKTLFCPCIKLCISQTLILDAEESRFVPSEFAQQLRCKNAEIPDIYFSVLDAADIYPTLVSNQDAKTIVRGSQVPSKKRLSEASKTVHAMGRCL